MQRTQDDTDTKERNARRRPVAPDLAELADADLFALAMEESDHDRAARALAEAGGATGLVRLSFEEIVPLFRGRERASRRALAALAAFELGRRASMRLAAGELRDTFLASAAVVAWAIPRLAPLEHEELWGLALDGRHRLRAARRIAMGGAHGLSVRAPDILRPMIRAAASGFVLVHNHPSGDASPSAEDRALTRALTAAADVVGTPLLDHVIVAAGASYSFLDAGAL